MAVDLRHVSWRDVGSEAYELAVRNRHRTLTGVYGVPRGGVPVACLAAPHLALPLVEEPGAGTLVVDDLVDSGRTFERVVGPGMFFDALYRKPWSPPDAAPAALVTDAWVVFPWERTEAPAEDGVVRLLESIGEDPCRDGLVDTPGRVVRAFAEMTNGLHVDPAVLLAKRFDADRYDEMIVLAGVTFTSLCEHHLLPFTGTVDVGYIANGPVVGVSKLARLVEVFAHRLQLQERMTDQIARALWDNLAPTGVAVIIRAQHSCMACRGVRKPGAVMVTSSMLGAMRTKPEARNEFIRLCAP